MGEETAARRDADDERLPRDGEREGASGPDDAAPAGATVEEAGRESFPASDPPATWSGPDIVPEPAGEADDARADGDGGPASS